MLMVLYHNMDFFVFSCVSNVGHQDSISLIINF